MKRALTIGLAGAGLAATLTLVGAASTKRAPAVAAETMPAHQSANAVRAIGLSPLGEPVRRGTFYVLHAVDPRGAEQRVVIDAEFGDIIAITPLRGLTAAAYAPPPVQRGGPRIIQVPQPEDYAALEPRRRAAVAEIDDGEELPPRRAVPRFSPRSEKPAPAEPPRRVLSAVKPIHDGPSPIRPLPRYDAKAEQGEKFGPPGSITPGAPPPAVLPQSEAVPASEPVPAAQ
ncbi:MAG: hypothetical protein Q8M26_09015 [Pseudolabrys sp.]|nr:hypothetical protein [Pseudolabrys sp.]